MGELVSSVTSQTFAFFPDSASVIVKTFKKQDQDRDLCINMMKFNYSTTHSSMLLSAKKTANAMLIRRGTND